MCSLIIKFNSFNRLLLFSSHEQREKEGEKKHVRSSCTRNAYRGLERLNSAKSLSIAIFLGGQGRFVLEISRGAISRGKKNCTVRGGGTVVGPGYCSDVYPPFALTKVRCRRDAARRRPCPVAGNVAVPLAPSSTPSQLLPPSPQCRALLVPRCIGKGRR